MKRTALVVLLTSAAAGCASLPAAPVRPAVYDFGPGPLNAPATHNPALPALALQDFRAPPALDNPAVLYRLPAVSLFAFCIAGVSLGIAQGAIDYFAETTRTRTSYYTGRNLADFVT